MNKDEFTNSEMLVGVGDGHKLNVIDWGKKDAKVPIIFLHGGPGGSVKDWAKWSFNPYTQRVIFFDQRGCGKSTPYGSLVNNTTEDLAKDITKIAKKLKINKFYLHGYSWGSTLALYYAITYPELLAGLVIGGVFSGSEREIDQMYDLAEVFYPDTWDRVVRDTPEESELAPISYHLDKALNGTKEEQKKSSYVMDYLESTLCKFDPRSIPENYDEYDPSGMQIEVHYITNNAFMPKDYIFDNVNKIRVPVYIVQGRFDIVCPPNFAYRISKIIPDCKLYWTISNHMPDHEIGNVFKSIFDSIS